MAERKRVYRPLRVADGADILVGLFDRSCDRLTAQDLDAIGAMQAPAIATLRALGAMADGVMRLVQHDSHEVGCGALQDAAAVVELMQLVAGVTDHVTSTLELVNAVDLARAAREP